MIFIYFDFVKTSIFLCCCFHHRSFHHRESFRHHSWLSPVAAGIIVGLGVEGYRLAIDALARRAKG